LRGFCGRFRFRRKNVRVTDGYLILNCFLPFIADIVVLKPFLLRMSVITRPEYPAFVKRRAFFWSVWLSTFLLLTSACNSRARQYAAFGDLTFGSYTVNFYTNGEFEIEMGMGYHEGHYALRGDTIRLAYQEGPLQGMPTRLLLTPKYLITLPSPQYPRSTRIRWQ